MSIIKGIKLKDLGNSDTIISVTGANTWDIDDDQVTLKISISVLTQKAGSGFEDIQFLKGVLTLVTNFILINTLLLILLRT